MIDDEYSEVETESTESEPVSYGSRAYVFVDEKSQGYQNTPVGTSGQIEPRRQRSIIPAVIITALLTTTICLIIGYLYFRELEFTNTSQESAAISTPAVTAEEAIPTSTPSLGLIIGSDSKKTESENGVITDCMRTVVSINIESVSTTIYGNTVSRGSGSGVIITSDGYIVTCNHVIENASSVSVSLQDGTTYEAEVVGYDSRTDLAIIKIDAKNLPAATIGDSNSYSVGDKVYAIGNPLGEYASTVTNGIISGIDRSVEIDGVSMTLMQTDAAINPGNSGGGLFSAATGELLGIVNAKNYGTEIEGLGFAIPTSAAHDVIIDLMDKGFVTGRPYLGISPETVQFTTGGGFFGFGTVTNYVRIKSVMENSPAEKAGLMAGDYILKIGDTQISTSDDVSNALNNYNAGDTVEIEIQRDNSTKTVTVILGERSGK